MVDRRFLVYFAAALLAVSGATYVIHFFLFEDLHHILIFFVEDIAFIPIEVLLVTIVIHRLLESRAKAERRDKLGMLIGAFFSTVGIDLLAMLDPGRPGPGRGAAGPAAGRGLESGRPPGAPPASLRPRLSRRP